MIHLKEQNVDEDGLTEKFELDPLVLLLEVGHHDDHPHLHHVSARGQRVTPGARDREGSLGQRVAEVHQLFHLP